MAKVVKRQDGRKRSHRDDLLPLGRENFMIMGVGVVLILLGYFALNEGSVEGILPLYIAPILLVLGYCVVIPLGIIRRKKQANPVSSDPGKSASSKQPSNS